MQNREKNFSVSGACVDNFFYPKDYSLQLLGTGSYEDLIRIFNTEIARQ